MMFKIAFRNIFRQKRRTTLTVLTMLGGFVLSSISIAWSDGSYGRLIDMFTRNQLGHIQVHAEGYLDRPSLYKTINDYPTVGKRIEDAPGVVSWAPRIFSAGLVSIGEKTSGVRIVGIDPERENATTRFDLKVRQGSSFTIQASKQCLLGEGLAKTMKARIGDEAVIVSQAADGSIANDLYTVAGLLSTGDQMADQRSFYLHLEDARELFVLEGRVHEIAVVGTDLDDVDILAADLTQSLSEPTLA
ncbi:MAG: ABC transporter permease, partial [bacterium]|nr:ABC transporter permease [bacterium]